MARATSRADTAVFERETAALDRRPNTGNHVQGRGAPPRLRADRRPVPLHHGRDASSVELIATSTDRGTEHHPLWGVPHPNHGVDGGLDHSRHQAPPASVDDPDGSRGRQQQRCAVGGEYRDGRAGHRSDDGIGLGAGVLTGLGDGNHPRPVNLAEPRPGGTRDGRPTPGQRNRLDGDREIPMSPVGEDR